jgi:hypothetical protein
MKTGCSLAEYSKQGYGSKRAVLPIIMMILYICSLPIYIYIQRERERERERD